jgi:hypothetical protein
MSKSQPEARVPRPIETEAGLIEFVPAYAYFAPPEEAWQRLQDLHHRALGAKGPFQTEVANELSPADAFSAFSHTTIAVNAQLAASGPEARNALLHSLGEFATSHGSLDGLEGVLLNAGWSAREQPGALGYTAKVLTDVGLPERLGGGAQTTFLFDGQGQLGLYDKDGLAGALAQGRSPEGHAGGKVPVEAGDLAALYEPHHGLAPRSDPTGLGAAGPDGGDGDPDWTPEHGGEGSGLEHEGGADKTPKGSSKPAEKRQELPQGTKSGKDLTPEQRKFLDKEQRTKDTWDGAGKGLLVGGIVCALLASRLGPQIGALCVAASAAIGARAGQLEGEKKRQEERRLFPDGRPDQESGETSAEAAHEPYALSLGAETGCPAHPDEGGWPHPWLETFMPTGPGIESLLSLEDDGRVALDNLPSFDGEGQVTDPGFLTEAFFEELVAIPADPDTPVTPGLEPIADPLVDLIGPDGDPRLDQPAHVPELFEPVATDLEVLEELRHEYPHH